jgi:hypothetical protein
MKDPKPPAPREGVEDHHSSSAEDFLDGSTNRAPAQDGLSDTFAWNCPRGGSTSTTVNRYPRTVRRALVLPVLVLLVSSVFEVSCTNGPEGCRFLPFNIDVPTQRASDVASLTQSGPGCGNGTPYCEDGKSPCLSFGTSIGPGSTFRGACTVTVTFKRGAPPFVATATFGPESDCPTGGVPTPMRVVVPATVPAFDGGKD